MSKVTFKNTKDRKVEASMSFRIDAFHKGMRFAIPAQVSAIYPRNSVPPELTIQTRLKNKMAQEKKKVQDVIDRNGPMNYIMYMV